MKKFLLISISLHLFIFFFRVNQLSTRDRPGPFVELRIIEKNNTLEPSVKNRLFVLKNQNIPKVKNKMRDLNEFSKLDSPMMFGKGKSESRPNSADAGNGLFEPEQGRKYVRSQKWAQGLSAETLAELQGFIKILTDQISSEVKYEEELSRDYAQGEATIDIEVNDVGQLRAMNVVESTDSRITGLILLQVRRALTNPLVRKAPLAILKLSLHVKFKILYQLNPSDDSKGVGLQVNAENEAEPEPVIEGNSVSLERVERKESKYDLTAGPTKGFFKWLLGKKIPSARDGWDLNRQTNNLAHSCDVEQVPEVCFKAGENYEILGEVENLKKYYSIACEFGFTKACEKIKKSH